MGQWMTAVQRRDDQRTAHCVGNWRRAEQRVIVRMPGGFEYRAMEVAQATVLKGTGAIKYDWQKTHSSLAEVEHTPAGPAS